MLKLHSEIKATAPEIDAIINVVSGPQSKKVMKIADDDIFDRYEQVMNYDFKSSLLLGNLAGNFLSPNGFVGYNGGHSDIYLGSEKYIDALEKIAYSVSIK